MHSSIEKLQKLFRLERERGFDNRAVVGGLDKILPAWEAEARSTNLPEGAIEKVQNCLRDYPSIEQDLRAETLDRLVQDLNVAFPAPAARGASGSQRSPTPRPVAPPRPRVEAAPPAMPVEPPPPKDEDYPEEVKASIQPQRPAPRPPPISPATSARSSPPTASSATARRNKRAATASM